MACRGMCSCGKDKDGKVDITVGKTTETATGGGYTAPSHKEKKKLRFDMEKALSERREENKNFEERMMGKMEQMMIQNQTEIMK